MPPPPPTHAALASQALRGGGKGAGQPWARTKPISYFLFLQNLSPIVLSRCSRPIFKSGPRDLRPRAPPPPLAASGTRGGGVIVQVPLLRDSHGDSSEWFMLVLGGIFLIVRPFTSLSHSPVLDPTANHHHSFSCLVNESWFTETICCSRRHVVMKISWLFMPRVPSDLIWSRIRFNQLLYDTYLATDFG